uniref:Mpo1 family 2-hydroxy fatty acid dioxygenase n=1 Tax=uncultured Acinetobacter sp. TaxID=165433 RepID=UPI00260D5F0E|nr:Mpo1-like protein [uncultured Acinetobacter sp.]
MDKLTQNLSQYGAYHLSQKNVATHIVGIPLIVASIILLCARWQWTVAGIDMNFAQVLIVVSSIYYLRLDRIMGLIMFVILMAMAFLIQPLASASLWVLLGSAIGLFVVGWVFQFIGHAYEKMKPAFFDDLKGLLIGPIFVLAEIMFKFGYRPNLEKEVTAQAVQLRRQLNATAKQTA